MLKVITFCWNAEQRDKPIRTVYCQWIIHRHINYAAFDTRVLLTDEAGLTRDGIFNYHSSYLWSEKNPHAHHVGNHQPHFSINVWAGIIGDDLLGPCRIQGRLTGASYLHFLQDELPLLLTYEHANKCGFFTMELLHTYLLMSGLFEHQFS
jgi:hypothetical protein